MGSYVRTHLVGFQHTTSWSISIDSDPPNKLFLIFPSDEEGVRGAVVIIAIVAVVAVVAVVGIVDVIAAAGLSVTHDDDGWPVDVGR